MRQPGLDGRGTYGRGFKGPDHGREMRPGISRNSCTLAFGSPITYENLAPAPSSVISLIDDVPEVIREGKGPVALFA